MPKTLHKSTKSAFKFDLPFAFVSSILCRVLKKTSLWRTRTKPSFEQEFSITRNCFSYIPGEELGVILDLSCGQARMGRTLLQTGFPGHVTVIGADSSLAMLEDARLLSNADGVHLFLIQCDAACLPFATGSISGIYAGSALHVWSQVPESLSEIYRVLQPGGRLVMTTAVALYEDSSPLLLAITERVVANLYSTLRVFTTEELFSLVKEAGLTDVQVVSISDGMACVLASKQ
mmetsp:Transcript_15335/g.25311  ORF Transcript_15335/g.25311 Transcript_15335/m.25311 type:complete len:233 (+) Transcript_15335:474-1172(+)|eukprot:CAMPEP_0184660724 /NCGR_PEP_ID=MMETSP0308-20130426/34921_1 /TAXON_ID=38269 /ORGANISM="Gloeochaete witrockiana, Strain SAG 46.84" /LENGTH=232 /DNA_ID=CAMNT_0027101515 /DNA_START=460 /DNA_END=1158 /DNA_ORIENTATION=-